MLAKMRVGATLLSDSAMLAILGLFSMALAAAFIIDPSADDEVLESEGVSDQTNQPFAGMGETLQFIEPSSSSGVAAESDEGVFFDLRDQVNVTAFATDNDDEMLGGTGTDYLSGRDGDDLLDGGAGDDELHGDLGDDLIFGAEGDDSLLGHVGDDTLYGDNGDDQLTGGDGMDALFGGAGNDALSGNLSDDDLDGGAGEDVLFGGQGDDNLSGGEDVEKDFLNGGAGNDQIVLRSNDVANGGDGNDTFTVTQDSSSHVSDYDPLADQIELEYEGDIAPELSTATTDSGLMLLANGEEVLTLDGVTSLDLAQIRLIKV